VKNGSTNPLEIELAGVGKESDWKVGDLIQRLAKSEPRQDQPSCAEKWLFIAVKWLYDNKAEFNNPLGDPAQAVPIPEPVNSQQRSVANVGSVRMTAARLRTSQGGCAGLEKPAGPVAEHS
jgi:hypothetical protein